MDFEKGFVLGAFFGSFWIVVGMILMAQVV